MSARYTADGKRKSSMTHARHRWTCDCGFSCFGNGGSSSHKRACRVWAEAELARNERFLTSVSSRGYQTDTQRKIEAQQIELRERLGLDA